MALTDIQIRQLRLAKGERRHLPDGQVPGLMLRASGTDGRTWSLLYRPNGKQRRVTLGHYPDLAVRDARKKALGLINGDGDEPARRGGLTVKDLVAQFVREHCADLRKKPEIEQVMRDYVLPHLGDRAAASLVRADAKAVIEAAKPKNKPGEKRRGGPAVATAVRKWGALMYSWAQQEELVEANPFALVRVPAAKTRDHTPSIEECRAIWRAADSLGYPYGPVVKLLLATAARRDEVAEMSWPEVNADKKLVEIPASRFKGKRPAVLVIPDSAWPTVEALPRWTEGAYVFSTTAGRRPVSGFTVAKVRLEKALAEADATVRPFVLHDFRRACASWLGAEGVEGIVIEAVLNHQLGGVAGIYNRYNYVTQRREALEKWVSALKAR